MTAAGESWPVRWAGVLALIDHRTPDGLIYRAPLPDPDGPRRDVPALNGWPRPLMWRTADDAGDRMQAPEEIAGHVTRAWCHRLGSGHTVVLGEGVATGPAAGALGAGHQLLAQLSAHGECRPCTAAGATCLELVDLTVAAVRVYPPGPPGQTGNFARIWAAPVPRPDPRRPYRPTRSDARTAELIALLGAEL